MSNENPPFAGFLRGPVRNAAENLDYYRRAILGDKYNQQVQLAHPQCAFEQLFKLWVNEHYQSFLRRFALRDMLRSFTTPAFEPSNIQYFVCQNAPGLLALVREPVVKEYGGLAHLLETRPTLNREFCSELGYILNHQLIPESSLPDLETFATKIIADLPENLARELWAILPPTSPSNLSDRLSIAFDKAIPSWLRSRLYDEIAQQITDCVNYWLPELSESSNDSLVYRTINHAEVKDHPEMRNVIIITEFVRQQAFMKDPDYQIIATCLGLLEDKITDGLTHLPWSSIAKIAPHLDDPQLTYRCIRRSLLALYHSHLREDKRRTEADAPSSQSQPPLIGTTVLPKHFGLIWAYGFIKAYAPHDTTLAEAIEYLIRC